MRIAILAGIGIGAFLLVFLPGYFLVVPSGPTEPEEMQEVSLQAEEELPPAPGPPPPVE
jgi:hypothetical protein